MISDHVIGLTGGMGCGKSLVSRMLAERGMIIVDADQITRMVHQDPTICHQLVTAFGAEVVDDPDCDHPVVNRKTLGQMAFSSAYHLKKLNEIMQPALLTAVKQIIGAESGQIVLDAALLFESGWNQLVDKTVVVLSPMDLRVRRIHERDGLSPEQIYARMDAQMRDTDRVLKADYLLYNVGTIEMLRKQVECLFGA